MRILNIYYQNINSLGGEGRVFFDQSPLADSGVFAITGPNGSGKTSILDVITLGLYGETYRFDKPAQHIMTKQSHQSIAQVEFAYDGEKYRSLWQVNSEDIHNPSMRLEQISEPVQILAETPHQVRTQLQKIIGMDFHKFCKSIVLPQGDFAAFLNALDSERMDILEKISGTEIYSEYQAQNSAQRTELTEKITRVEKEAELLPLLSDDELHAAELDLQDFQELCSELSADHEQLQQQLLKSQQLTALENQTVKLKQQQQLLQNSINKQQSALQRIANAGDSLKFQHELSVLENLQGEVELNRINLTNYRSELVMLQQQLAHQAETPSPEDLQGKTSAAQKQLLTQIKQKVTDNQQLLPKELALADVLVQQINDKKTTLAEIERWLATNQNDARLLTDFPDVVRYRNLREALQEQENYQKNHRNWDKNTQAAIKKTKNSLSTVENRLKELDALILTNRQIMTEMSADSSQADLHELLAVQQSRVNDFQALHTIAETQARLGEKKGFFSWFSRKSTPVNFDENTLQTRLDSLKHDLSIEENIGKALEQVITNENLLKKLTSYRKHLVDGKPCYLCGSTLHPYSIKPPIFTDSKKALADQRTKLQILKATVENAEKQLAAMQKQSAHQTAKQHYLQDKASEWSLLVNRLNIAFEGVSIDDLALHKKLLAEETDELGRIKKLIGDYARLQQQITNAELEIPHLQLNANSLRDTLSQLETEWSARQPEITELEQNYSSIQAEEKALNETLQQILTQLGEKMPGKGKEDALFDRLNTRRQDYQIRELRQTGLREEIANLEDQLRHTEAQIKLYQQQLNEQQVILTREEWLSLHLAILEKQQLIVQLEQQIATQQLSVENLQFALSKNIAAFGFENIAELHEMFNLIARKDEIEHLLAEENIKLDNAVAELQTLESRLSDEHQANEGATPVTEILAAQALLTEKIKIAELEIRSLQTKLQKQQQYRRYAEDMQTELLGLRQQWAEVNQEYLQINDNQGGFRRLIQQILIDKLLSQANLILEQISGRYFIRSNISEHGLALEIEDTRQNNVRRLPKTLSGGESFVISLALALALAEIANNGKTIESLFLDEGFGNLDAEALYLALNALDGLKIQGKTVGVISHVEGVKKRIKTQIELVKKADGLSELKMVA